jgi:hypothetical protein
VPRHMWLNTNQVSLWHRSWLRVPTIQPLHNLHIKWNIRPTYPQNSHIFIPYNFHIIHHFHSHSHTTLHVYLHHHANLTKFWPRFNLTFSNLFLNFHPLILPKKKFNHLWHFFWLPLCFYLLLPWSCLTWYASFPSY